MFVIFPSSTLLAQDYNRYTPITSTGEIPQELLRRSSDKFEKQKGQIDASENKKDRKSREDFLLQSNFVVDELLLSGKVLFNDPISAYITRIKDYLLRDQPEYRDKIRIYVVKSPAVNAFATNDGVVLVNMGLLARLNNEAQLAFVLAHEFQHFIHQHPITRYVRSERIRQKTRLIDNNSIEEFLMAKNQYQRELEIDADKKGLELYLESAYSVGELTHAFDMLRDADRPFEERKWDKAFFENENLVFPAAFVPDTLVAIEASDDSEDDRFSTHPALAARRKLVDSRIEGLDTEAGAQFIFGEAEFLKYRKMCRFELSHLHLFHRQYERAIYNCWLLLRDHPESFYLQKIIAQSLYGLVVYRNARNFYEVHLDHQEVPGEAQRLHYFMEQLDKPALNVFALQYCWLLHQRHRDDAELGAIARDLVAELFEHHRETAEGMSDISAPAGFFDHQEVILADSDDVEMPEEPDDYYQFAFAPLFADTTFLNAYEENLDIGAPADRNVYLSPRKRRRLRKRMLLQGEALDLNKVLFVTPLYKMIDERKDVPVEYVASEKALDDFVQMIDETASLAGLNHEILTNTDLEAGDVDRLNDMSLLKNWIGEFMAGDENTRMENIFSDEARQIAEKYGTNHIAFTGTIMLTRRRSAVYTAAIAVLGVYIVTIPWVIYKLSKPDRAVLYVNIVFDVDKDEVELNQTRILRAGARKSILKSTLYDSMLQMHAK